MPQPFHPLLDLEPQSPPMPFRPADTHPCLPPHPTHPRFTLRPNLPASHILLPLSDSPAAFHTPDILSESSPSCPSIPLANPHPLVPCKKSAAYTPSIIFPPQPEPVQSMHRRRRRRSPRPSAVEELPVRRTYFRL